MLNYYNENPEWIQMMLTNVAFAKELHPHDGKDEYDDTQNKG